MQSSRKSTVTVSAVITEQSRIRACAIALYILCPIPLFIMDLVGMETIGLCGTLGIVAVATVLIVLSRRDTNTNHEAPKTQVQESPESELRKSVGSLIGTLGFVTYLVVSFLTGAWYITWLIFPILGAVRGLVFAIMDLKEANKNEA